MTFWIKKKKSTDGFSLYQATPACKAFLRDTMTLTSDIE